jgi:hypothetical protein
MSTTNFSNDPGTGQSGPDNGSSSDSSGAKEQAKQTAGTAKDETQRVAGVAKDEAQRVTDEAKTQVRGLLDDATSQVDEQSKAQKARLAETVRTFGDDLDSMTAHTHDSAGIAGTVVQQVADQARSLAGHLEDREPRELLEDVRGYARRNPGTFLLGALAAGVVVGRLTRGVKAAQDHSPTTPKARSETPSPASGVDTTTESEGHPDAGFAHDLPAPTDLGAKGVQMSESGIAGPGGGRV